MVEVNQFLGEVFSFARDFGTSASDLIDSVAQNARGYFQKPSYFEEMVRKITALFVRFNFSVRKLFSSYLVPSAYEARDLFATKLSVVNRYANQALGKGLIQSVTSVIEIIEEYCMIWMSRLLEAARYFSEFLLTWTKAVYSGITNGNVREIVTQCRAGVRTGLEFVHGKFLTMYSSLCIDNIAKILRGLIPETLQLSISGVLLVTGIGFISLAYLLSA